MREHLTEEQLNELMLGDAGSAASQHLEVCAMCRREAEELRQALEGFRDSIHATAKPYNLPWRAPAPLGWRTGERFMVRRWVYAPVLAAILVISGLLLRIHLPRNSHQTAKAVGEEEILVEVQADVGHSVPDALTPGELLLAGMEGPPPPGTVNSTSKTARGSRR